MFDEIPISTIKLPEGRFQTFHDISLSEELRWKSCRPKNKTFIIGASPEIVHLVMICYRVKHNNGSICKSLLLCGIISYLLLSYIGKLYINPCLNGWAMLSQNFSILAQTVSEIWHKMYPKTGPFCALCCCTWNFTLFLNYVTHLINWNLSFECIYWFQKLLRIILMFSLLKLIKNCGSYDQICK